MFTNLLLADEINRAPAKVQSALLEVMQERQVTIGRETFKVPDPFLVLATQNPIETEGTYALPEAQVDRFMLKVLVGYPSADRGVRHRRADDRTVSSRWARCSRPTSCSGLQQQADAVYVDPALIRVRRPPRDRDPRPGERAGCRDLARYITFGASPRASINLILTARALAFVRGRDYVLPQDVLDMALDVMRHRLVLSFEALSDDVTPDDLLRRDPRPRSPSRRSRSESMSTPASAPERILQRLDWQVVRRLDGLLQGDYRTLFRGHGIDLADLREYQPGDDVRAHRLERHRPDGRALRPRVPRGPRDHRVVPARPEPVASTSGRSRRNARSGRCSSTS